MTAASSFFLFMPKLLPPPPPPAPTCSISLTSFDFFPPPHFTHEKKKLFFFSNLLQPQKPKTPNCILTSGLYSETKFYVVKTATFCPVVNSISMSYNMKLLKGFTAFTATRVRDVRNGIKFILQYLL